MADLHEKIVVKVNPARVPGHVRVCTMSNLSTDDVGLALKKWLHVAQVYGSHELLTVNVQQQMEI